MCQESFSVSCFFKSLDTYHQRQQQQRAAAILLFLLVSWRLIILLRLLHTHGE
jgi:hypothetical protein